MWYLLGFVFVYILIGLRIINEYERGVYFTLGKYTGIKHPGLKFIWPIIQSMTKVDIRTKTLDIPSQDCITKDNVTVKVNAVLFFKVQFVDKSILKVEEYNYAVSQLAQTTMRNIVGQFELNELLQKREEISENIKTIVDELTDPWGIDIENIEVKDIELPESMKRTIGKVAEAEREKNAVIINSEGEVIASQNLAKAAKVLSSTPGALHLRTLQTLNDVSSDESNTIIFALPIEVLNAYVNSASKSKKE